MAADKSGRAIFISYRRDDSEGEAGRLFDDLVRAYGEDSVFMDVTGIQPGLDFRKAIDANVASCGVLLAIIGPSWASVTASDGTRRLDNPTDFVRLEIASALARQTAVIPVLVHGAKMPPLDQLPDDLKDLRYRNSVEITHARWNSDVALLVTALKSYVTVNPAHQTETVHATIPVQLPAPQPPVAIAKRKSFFPIGITAAALVVVLAGVLTALYFHSSASQPAPVAVPSTPAVMQPSAQTTPTVPAAQAAVPSANTALLGKWTNATEPAAGDNLEQISVADFGGQLMVQAWGKCDPHPCSWGSRKATRNGAEAVTESWELRNNALEIKQQRTATLSLQPSTNGLQVTVHNTFQMPNGQIKENFNPLQFVRTP